MKRVTVVFARPGLQRLWQLDLPDDATVRQALEAAAARSAPAGEGGGKEMEIPWESASLGIYGEPCRRGDIPRDGDRVEICRPLLNDPRERRRQQVRRRP